MQHVPQFIDTRDKVAGPLTWEQLYWMGGALGVGIVLWQILERVAFWIVIFPIVGAALAFAFIRPQKLSLLTFVKYAIVYYFTPRMYLWQREINSSESSKDGNKDQEESQVMPTAKKNVTLDDISSLSEVLDSHGAHVGDKAKKMLGSHKATGSSNSSWRMRSKS